MPPPWQFRFSKAFCKINVTTRMGHAPSLQPQFDKRPVEQGLAPAVKFPFVQRIQSRFTPENVPVFDAEHLSQVGQAVGFAAGDEHLPAPKLIEHKILPSGV